MNLHTSHPYSLLLHGIKRSYPSLSQNIKTDVAIMGAGITGAQVGWQLARAGVPCVLVDKRHVATGSTAASTSLIQYEIDTPLHQLIQKVGYCTAVESYLLCRQAVHDLEAMSRTEGIDCCFRPKSSLQFASFKKQTHVLEQEFKARNSIGLNVSLLYQHDLVRQFGLKKAAGLFSTDAAQLDAYLLTHQLLNQLVEKGNAVYDHTLIVAINHNKHGVELLTEEGLRISAKKLVIACGYESQRYLPHKVEDLYVTYAILSEPLAREEFWRQNALIWEKALPYLYLRTTDDHRILVGGKDTPYHPKLGFRLLSQKAKALHRSFERLFPHLSFKTDFAWAGVFGTTKDGLPYAGTVPERPHTYFALGYGGNGITFSVIAAQLIRDLITGKHNPYLKLFSFER